jgi:ABC-2 type transport system permease protein
MAGLVVGISAMWPSFQDFADFAVFLDSYPDYMKRLFNIDELTSGVGFLNAELFSIIVPALFIVYGIGRGARFVAGEEEAGTLEMLLVSPVPRARILIEKAAGLGAGVAALGAVLFLAVVASSALFGMEIGTAHAAAATATMVLIGVQHGWLALAVGAATGKRALAIGVAATAAVAAYVLYVAGALVTSMERWQLLSPFTQALEGGPLGGGIPAAAAWMLVTGVAVVAVAVPLFARRDVVAH